MKIFTKKYWQIKNANRKMFMFKYAYNTKSKVQCIFAPFVITIVLFMLLPVAVMRLVVECMEKTFDVAFPIIREAIGMDMQVNPEWYELSQQDKINRWKTWE